MDHSEGGSSNATLDAVKNAIAAVSDWLAAGHAQPNTDEGLAKLVAIRAALADLSDALAALTDARGYDPAMP